MEWITLSEVSSTKSSPASNSFLNLSENNSYSDEILEDCFQEVKLKRLEHPHNFFILNINSIRQKFYEVEHLLRENIVDFLAFSETKIAELFLINNSMQTLSTCIGNTKGT